MKQGQSAVTEEKARGFSSVFEQQIAVVSRSPMLTQQPYVHVDLHAGCGFNHEVGVIGSPMLFLETARRHRLDYRLFCCEIDRGRCDELGKRMKHDHRAFPHFGHNADMCDCVPDLMRMHGIEPNMAVGSVLIDPNGFSDQIPWDSLERLFAVCGRLDVIFNFPGLAYTRNRGHAEHVHIDLLPKRLRKQCWFIRQPLPVQKFTLCVGRNTGKLSIPTRNGLPFARWDSIEGKRYRLRAMLKSEEYERLPLPGQMELRFG